MSVTPTRRGSIAFASPSSSTSSSSPTTQKARMHSTPSSSDTSPTTPRSRASHARFPLTPPTPKSPRRIGTSSGNSPEPAVVHAAKWYRCGRRPPMSPGGKTLWVPASEAKCGDDGDDEGGETDEEDVVESGLDELKRRQVLMQRHAATKLLEVDLMDESDQSTYRFSSPPRTSPTPRPKITPPSYSVWSSSSESASSSPSTSPMQPLFPSTALSQLGDRPIESSPGGIAQRDLLAPFRPMRPPCPPCPSPSGDYVSERSEMVTRIPRLPWGRPRRARFASDDGLAQIRVFERQPRDEDLRDYFCDWAEQDKDEILTLDDSNDNGDLELPDAGLALPSTPSPPTSTPTPSTSPAPGATPPSDALTTVFVAIASLKLAETLTLTSERSIAAADLLAGASITPADSSSSPSPIPSPHTGTSTSTPDATQPLEDFEGTPVLTSCQAPENTLDQEWPSAMGAPPPPTDFFEVEPKETPATVTDFVVA